MLRRPEGDLKPCLWPRCVGYMVPRLRIFVLGRSRIMVRAVISSFGELSLLSLKLRGNHCAGVTYGRAKVKVWNCEIVKAVWRVRDCLYHIDHFQLACLLNRVSGVPFYCAFFLFMIFLLVIGDDCAVKVQFSSNTPNALFFCVEFGTSEGFKPIPACGAAESFQQDFPVSKLAFTNWLCSKIRKCQHRIKQNMKWFCFFVLGEVIKHQNFDLGSLIMNHRKSSTT